MTEDRISRLTDSLLRISENEAKHILDDCFKQNGDFKELVALAAAALERIGEGFERDTVALSQVYMSGRICEEVLLSYFPQDRPERLNGCALAIATLVDQHALGKRIVTSVLRAAGYPPLDFGAGLSARELVDKIVEHDINVILISTLMYAAAIEVKTVTTLLKEEAPDVLVIAGGAPFRLDETLWQVVGADYDGGSGMDLPKLIARIIEGGCAA